MCVSDSRIRNHGRVHPAPCVRPRRVCSVFACTCTVLPFDDADATADVQWHCNHRPPLWYHYFQRSEHNACGYPGLLDRKNRSDMCRRWESNPRLPAWTANTLSTRPGAPLDINAHYFIAYLYIWCEKTLKTMELLDIVGRDLKLEMYKFLVLTSKKMTKMILKKWMEIQKLQYVVNTFPSMNSTLKHILAT